MSDIIELCARAITRAKCTGSKAHLDEQEEYWRSNEHLAKAVLQTLADNPDEGALEASFKEWDKEDWPGWPDTVAAIQAYLNHIKGVA